MAKITVMFGSNIETEHNLEKDELRVGRAMDCDIVVDNLGVSRHHCSIVRDGSGWALVDKGSNNGTFVGGTKVTKHILQNQERVILGKHSLVFDAHGYAQSAGAKKGPAGMGGEMTMFVDQAALAKAMAAAQDAKRMALVISQGGRDVVMQLMRDETTLGNQGADVPAKGFLVKPLQAKIVRTGTSHRLLSMGGWRAVKVNGQKITERELKAGDVIIIAGHMFTYRQA